MKANPQHIIQLHHFRRFLEAAAKARIDVAPLKGAYMLDLYGPNEDRGMMGDVDFLVREKDYARAKELLGSLGFVPRSLEDLDPQMHEAGFYLPCPPHGKLLFEVHRCLLEPRRFPLDHTGLWSRATATTHDGLPCRELAAEDHFLHIVIHAVIHRLDAFGRTTRDLSLLLEKRGIDHEVLAARARQWGVAQASWLYLDSIAARHPRVVVEPARSLLAPSPARRLGLRALRDHSVPQIVRRYAEQGFAFAIVALVFDRPQDVLRATVLHPTVAGWLGRLGLGKLPGALWPKLFAPLLVAALCASSGCAGEPRCAISPELARGQTATVTIEADVPEGTVDHCTATLSSIETPLSASIGTVDERSDACRADVALSFPKTADIGDYEVTVRFSYSYRASDQDGGDGLVNDTKTERICVTVY